MERRDQSPQEKYGLSCPVDGDFYICQNSPTQFVGCCSIDPCKNNGICPDNSLFNASFSKINYKYTLPEACVGSGLWYTCSGTTPPFLGCCLENPCENNGCSPDKLTAAKLSSNQTEAAIFLTSSEPSPTSSDISSSSASSTASSTSAPSSDSNSKSFPVGAIVGIVIGAVAAIAIIAFLIWRLRRSKKTFYHPPPVAQVPPSPQNEGHPHHPSGMYSPYKGKFLLLLFTGLCILNLIAQRT